MIDICANHSGVPCCYEGRVCPACALRDERDEVQQQVDRLQNEVEHLKFSLDGFKDDLDKARAELEERANGRGL